MEEIIKQLASDLMIYSYVDKDSNDIFYFFIANRDKIVFITDIVDIDDINLYTLKLSNLGVEIFNEIFVNEKLIRVSEEAEIVTNDTDISIPAFLWDLYVIGIHDINNVPAFKTNDIEVVKRDPFVARKIIVEYKDISDIILMIRKSIFLSDILISEIEKIELPKIIIKNLLDDVEVVAVSDNMEVTQNHQEVSTEDILYYLDSVIHEYID